MMSSVIPARLLFQCGHAALVSLPRVKGESPAQRSDRIAREKSAAQARSCDFCPPMAVSEVAQAVVVAVAMPEPAAPEQPVAPVVHAPLEAPVAHVAASDAVASSDHSVAHIGTPTPPARRAARPKRPSAPTVAPAAPVQNRHRSASYRFVVRFQTETVLHASDIRDALRQAELLGAVDVLGLAAIG